MVAQHGASARLHLDQQLRTLGIGFHDTHADCLRIITRAEMRMADEIDRGQAAGELPTKGQHANHDQGLGMSDLSLDSRRVAEWRDIHDAGPEVVEQAIQDAFATGQIDARGAQKATVMLGTDVHLENVG